MPPQRKTNGKKNKSASHQAKGKRKSKVDVTDVYEASDDERQLARKGHDLDDVDDYEYHVDHVNEEDDEEIDSDEAFDDSDDERFESFKFQGSTKVSWYCGLAGYMSTVHLIHHGSYIGLGQESQKERTFS